MILYHKNILILGILLLIWNGIFAQSDTSDRAKSADSSQTNQFKTTSLHSPKKATIMAMLLPGSGQIYNQKYWKAPIVYAGMVGSIYAIAYFRNGMRPLNDSISKIYSSGKSPSEQLIADRDKFKNRRDLSILCLVGIYAFQIIDATVDAHFFKFNVNDKITIELKPQPYHFFTLTAKLQ